MTIISPVKLVPLERRREIWRECLHEYEGAVSLEEIFTLASGMVIVELLHNLMLMDSAGIDALAT